MSFCPPNLRRLVGAAAAACFLGVLLSLRVAQAAGSPDIVPRFGVHETYDRVVLALPGGDNFSTHQSGSVLTLQLPRTGHVAPSAQTGKRVLGMDGGDGTLSIRMAPGTHAHVMRLNDRLVIDVLEGSASVPAAGMSADAPAPVQEAAAPAHIRRLPPRQLQLPPAAPALTHVAAAMVPTAAPVIAAKADPLPPSPQAPPQADAAAAPAAIQAAVPAGAAPLGPVPAVPPAASPATSNAPAGSTADSGPANATTGPVTAASQRAAVTLVSDAGLGGPAMLVPYGTETGVTVFRRGGDAHMVFDNAHPLDLSQLKDDSVFGDVTERVLPDGMHLRMKLAADAQIRVARQAGGWALAVVHGQPTPKPITAHLDKGVLSIAADSPGHVVVVSDETTGGKLLVGTQKTAGQYVPASHRDAEFVMQATWQGVVVEPLSDRLSMQPVRDGFALQATDGPKLALVWPDAPAETGVAGKIMTRRFDLPNLPPTELHNRLTQAMRDAALTPQLNRFVARMRVAQSLLSEGLDVEARAVIRAATSDEPAHADDADAAGMSAIASWLEARAGGPDGVVADGFDPSTLGTSDEARFWQALFKTGQADVSAPASVLAVTWPILLQYPPDLQRRLVPEAGRMLGVGGQDQALAGFLASFPDQTLDLVRAGLLQRQGKVDEASALYEAVARRPDRLMRAQALHAGVELRLATKKIDATEAAAALGRQLYAWRGGETDLAFRLRVADVRIQAGQWRQALALLRETDDAFPDAHPRVHEAETKLIAGLVHGDTAAKLGALDLVALADEASNLLSATDSDLTLAPILVDKLLALDLPGRAEPILQKLFDHAEDTTQKAELGVRLAGLQADNGDGKAALSTLAASDDSGLDTPLISRREMLRARLLAKAGHTGDAVGVLSSMQDEPALELQAGILEQSHQYPEAIKLLNSVVGNPGFAAMPAQAQRNLILRLANDESEIGDLAALHKLREAQQKLFTSGPDAELFAVLTQEPIKATDDLPRAARELDKLRALPASLSRAK